MTIKEMEIQTGLVRANIRYYESQGLISPVRRENGYRDYSRQDAETLLKVKLLRQLHVSLEDIQGLQKGERDLEGVLEQKIRELELERQDLDNAVLLCRELRQDRVDYATLDASRYLERCAAPAQVPAQDQLPHYIFPWRRYFARTLDRLLYGTAFTVLLQLFFRINILRQEAGFWRTLVSLLLMLGLEPLMLRGWGTTPGKALFGLKIVQADGSPLTLEQAFWRTGRVVLFWGGCVLLAEIPSPLTGLLVMGVEIYACICVYHERPLLWDRDDLLYLEGSTRQKPFWNWDSTSTTLRSAAYVLSLGLCIALMVGGHLWASAPPHRGAPLTTEEFTQNYNQMNRFFYGRAAQELELSGTLRDLPAPEGVVIVDPWDSGRPDPFFRYVHTPGNGLQEVRLLCAWEGTYSLPRREMALAACAFLWHDLGRTQVGELMGALYKQQGEFYFSYPNVEVEGRRDGGEFVFTMKRT